MTEKQRILKWFKRHKYLTVAQAIHQIKAYNLRSRASEMRLKATYINVKRDDGATARIARYELVDS